jgi:uncharacterized protein (TIGR00156 family)
MSRGAEWRKGGIRLLRPSLAAAAALLVVPAAGTRADYRGPGAAPGDLTVAQILKDPKDDRPVVLRGTLVRKVGREEYFFSDGTGEIRAEIDADLFPAETIDDKTRVEIAGEIDKDFMHAPEIDVDSVTRVQE